MTDLKSKPLCARCGHPVDRLTEDYDELTRTVRFTAYCHGQSEHTRLSYEATQSLASVTMGTAFVPPRVLTGVSDG